MFDTKAAQQITPRTKDNSLLMQQADTFDLKQLVLDLRAAATRKDASEQIRFLLEKAVQDPDLTSRGMPDFENDDTILFEDDSISVWHCRFQPGRTVPAHDHQMQATIAVYHGAERNDFFEKLPSGELKRSESIEVAAGDVLQIEPDAVHAVGCASPEPCCGIHVYQGNLTQVERSLFDTDRDLAMPFSEENYARLTRSD